MPAAFYAWQHVLAQVGGDTTVVYLLLLCQTNEANAEKPLSAKELGEMWKALSEEDKAPIQRQSRRAQGRVRRHQATLQDRAEEGCRGRGAHAWHSAPETVATLTRSQFCND